MSKKSQGSGTESYDYYGTIVGRICHGVVETLHTIIVDNKVVWEGPLHRAGETNYTTISIPNLGTIRFYWGTLTQTVDSALAGSGNNLNEDHPAYLGICYAVLVRFLFGRERQAAPNVQFVVTRPPTQSIITGSPTLVVDEQSNPVVALAEMLTNERFGLGRSETMLDTTSFQAAAELLELRNDLAYVSILLAERWTLAAFLDELTATCDLWLRENQAGKLEVGVWPSGNDVVAPTSLVLLDASNRIGRLTRTAQTWDSTPNRWAIKFNDRDRAFKDTAVPASILKGQRIVGGVRSSEIDRPFITRRDQALKFATEFARSNGHPKLTLIVTVLRSAAATLWPGSLCRVDVDFEPGSIELLQVCRVLRRSETVHGPVELTLEVDPAYAPTPYSSPNLGAALNAQTAPVELPYVRVIECPPLATDLDPNNVLVLAHRGDDITTGAEIWHCPTSVGTFELITTQVGFALRGTLQATYTDVATGAIRIRLVDDRDKALLAVSPGPLAAADNELVLILVSTTSTADVLTSSGEAIIEFFSISTATLVGGLDYDLTCIRARFGSIARTHTVGSNPVEAWIMYGSNMQGIAHPNFAVLRESESDIYFRAAPYSATDVRPVSSVLSRKFKFPAVEEYAPQIAWTNPVAAVSTSSGSFGTVNFSGIISDRDKNLVGYSITYQAPDGTVTVVRSEQLNTIGQHAFSAPLAITAVGTHTITVKAQDSTGKTTESTRILTRLNVAQAAAVVINGNRSFVSSTLITFTCPTPGSTIYYKFVAFGGPLGSGAYTAYGGATLVLSSDRRCYAFAIAPGVADSDLTYTDFNNTST